MTEKTESTQESPGNLPLYTCHKQVRAAKIAGAELLVDCVATARIDLANDSPSAVYVDSEWLMTRVRPDIGDGLEEKAALAAAIEKAIGGYYVEYEDGHTSWSPGDVFEAGYLLGGWEIPDEEHEALLAEGAEGMEFHAVPNGHDGGGAHAGVTLERVVDTADPHQSTVYALDEGPMLEMQSGPIAETGPNGFTIENLLAVVIDRLELFQAGEFNCQENKMAIHYARLALAELNARTAKRMERGVEGTHQV